MALKLGRKIRAPSGAWARQVWVNGEPATVGVATYVPVGELATLVGWYRKPPTAEPVVVGQVPRAATVQLILRQAGIEYDE